LIAQRTGVRRFRGRLAVAAAAFLVALVLALPAGVLGASVRLRDASVSPRTGTTATTFTFAVTYLNREGSGGPNEMVVLIDGVRHAMHGSGTNWRKGVRFTYSTRLPRGQHRIAFHSLGRDRFTNDLDAGTVRVTAASSSNPGTSPSATPDPAPSGSDRSSTGGSTGGTGGTSAVGGRGSADGGAPAASGLSFPTWGARAFTPGPPPAPAATPSGGVTAPKPAGASDGDRTEQPRAGAEPPKAGAGWGDLNAYINALSWGGSAGRSMPLLPSVVFSSGAMTLLMAFLFFGKRRRDGDPPEPDEVLQAAAARGAGHAATSSLVPNHSVSADVPPDEVGMPRWRRPSLLQARRTDPTRESAMAHAPMTFGRGGAAVAGYERRVIRYHVVRLLDAPDELRGEEIGVLARDDEVQVIERTGTYCRVLCPDGNEGWIHKMTLGDTVSESAVSSRQALAADDIDEDVLTAFMAARGRA
jgi:hypothetical protein